MTIAMESMAVEMPEVEGHPNRAAFRGVLTVVDVPSQRAPSGSKGRRVVLTRGAAEAALPSLIGMALDYAPSFDRHDVRRKVGVITSADVVGRNLEVGGYLYAKDFPDIVAEIAKSGWAPTGDAGGVCRTEEGPTAESVTGGCGGADSEFDGVDPERRPGEDATPPVLRAEAAGTNAGESGNVVRSDRRRAGRGASAGVDAGEGDIYWCGDSAEGEGGLSGYVDWLGDVKGHQGELEKDPHAWSADAMLHRSFAAKNAAQDDKEDSGTGSEGGKDE